VKKGDMLKVNLPNPWKVRNLYVGAVILIFIFIAAGVFFYTVGELEKPSISISPHITHIGQKATLTVNFADGMSGLGEVKIFITQGKEKKNIFAESYRGEKIKKKGILISIEPRALKLSDGPATVSFYARDRSIWKNEQTFHLLVTVDFTPPQISLLTPVTHISPGGAGMVIFRTSKPVQCAGVNVDEEYFPAYPIRAGNQSGYICYFALPIEVPSGKGVIKVMAQDQAGNETTLNVPYKKLKKKFRSDKMPLSEQFLTHKMPEFAQGNPTLKDKNLLDVFIYVNSEMRKENDNYIRSLCRQSEPHKLWEGAFLRMKNASPMAQFGDHRTYIYQGKEVGTSTHQGVDLASVANAPIEAANHGRVVFVGNLGIYGNTVILDHGQGIFSLYAHLADITVKNGQSVKKGETIGKSGQTGLAGGDHLHFSILVGGQFVDPKEWWDPHWIMDNIVKKMGEVKTD